MHDPFRSSAVLVTDFDGTLTRDDFYRLVLDELVPRDTPDYWSWYLAGKVTHFEALRLTFAAAPAGESALASLADRMGLQPNLAAHVDALHNEGWQVVVASAGCLWYIRRLLETAKVTIDVHANPGRIEDDRLVMAMPVDSPFFSPETGIDKASVVRDALRATSRVAFAGDGPPDLIASLLVAPHRRFARGHLAQELTRRGEPFRPFDLWSEVARALRTER